MDDPKNPPPSIPPAVPAVERRPPLTKPQKLVLQERALALKLAGSSYFQVGQTLSDPRVVAQLGLPLGFTCPKVMAWRLVDWACRPTADNVADSAEKFRTLQVRQCEEMIKSLWPTRANPRVADSIGRVQQRLARLLGLDAPEKIDLHKTGGSPADMSLEEAAAEIGRAAAALERAKRGGKLEMLAGGKATGTDGSSPADTKGGTTT